jgi:integrase/recombinase XerD
MTAPTFTSPLKDGLERFLQFKRAAGCRYQDEARALGCLDRFLDGYLAGKDPVITLEVVRAYVAQAAQRSDKTREHRLSLIRELCRFLAVEDPRTAIPPRNFLKIPRRPYVQRILTREEGKRFLAACASFPRARCSPLRGVVHGTALTLLYVTGLRLGEALRLTVGDVDLSRGLLQVRQTKFGKSRLVPISSDMMQRLQECASLVEQRLGSRPSTALCFAGPTGKPVSPNALRASFRDVLARAAIAPAGAGRRPRLHDLRGTFAVHRLLRWYEQDADLEAKLPLLVTYLGHVSLRSSQRYLQLAKDLLGEVTRRHQAHFGHLITEEQEGSPHEIT